MSDVTQMNLKDLAAAIKRRKVSSLEVTKAMLTRIEKWQPTLNAFALGELAYQCSQLSQGRRARRI